MIAAVALALLVALYPAPAVASVKNKALYCGACKGLFDEIEYVISTGFARKKISGFFFVFLSTTRNCPLMNCLSPAPPDSEPAQED